MKPLKKWAARSRRDPPPPALIVHSVVPADASGQGDELFQNAVGGPLTAEEAPHAVVVVTAVGVGTYQCHCRPRREGRFIMGCGAPSVVVTMGDCSTRQL